MPYCSHCHFWTRSPAEVGEITCPNCGKKSETPVPTAFTSDIDFLVGLAACFVLLGLVASGWMGPAAIIFGLLAGIVSLACSIVRNETSKKHAALNRPNPDHFPAAIFQRIHETLQKLTTHAGEIQELLEIEGSGPHSDRAEQRLELLQAALAHRQKRIQELTRELWAREVQLWLNQLEGFLSAQLPLLDKENAEMVHDRFTKLVTSGQALHARGETLPMDEIMPERAWRLLNDCLAKAPELEDRVRDARTLAVLGEDCDLPPELEPEGSWLHWLQEAIPSIELLPPEFEDDEEYLRVQTQLRLLRDGVKFPGTRSLDDPKFSLDPPTQRNARTLE